MVYVRIFSFLFKILKRNMHAHKTFNCTRIKENGVYYLKQLKKIYTLKITVICEIHL